MPNHFYFVITLLFNSLHVIWPTEPGTSHQLAWLFAGGLPPTSREPGWPHPAPQPALHCANVPHHQQVGHYARDELKVVCMHLYPRHCGAAALTFDLSLIALSHPLHSYMVLHLLHTLIPALDSRFSVTAKNLAVALGSTEEVSSHTRTQPSDTTKYVPFLVLSLQRSPPVGNVACWKLKVDFSRCWETFSVKRQDTKRSGVITAVSSLHRNKKHTIICHFFSMTQQATEMMRNIFSSFKANLREQRWTNKSVQMVIERVVCWANTDFQTIYLFIYLLINIYVFIF